MAVRYPFTSITINNNNLNEKSTNLKLMLNQISPANNSPFMCFLGVFIDPQLTFSHHVNLLTSKLYKSLFIMRKTKNILNEKALKSVYYSLFHCNIIYCLPIWSCASNNGLKPISILQKKPSELFSINLLMHTRNHLKKYSLSTN